MTTVVVSINTRAPALTDQFWIIRGDEELTEYNFMSRTAAPDWGYLRQTPCVFRFSPKPEQSPTEYRVRVASLEKDHIRINNYDRQGQKRCENYLFALSTCYFNHVGYDKMLYGFMAGNRLKEIEIVTWNGEDYLKFETVKPGDNVSQLTFEDDSHLVHRWDLISGTSKETTKHTNITPRGLVYNFLVSNEGYGFIPLRNVKRMQ